MIAIGIKDVYVQSQQHQEFVLREHLEFIAGHMVPVGIWLE